MRYIAQRGRINREWRVAQRSLLLSRNEQDPKANQHRPNLRDVTLCTVWVSLYPNGVLLYARMLDYSSSAATRPRAHGLVSRYALANAPIRAVKVIRPGERCQDQHSTHKPLA